MTVNVEVIEHRYYAVDIDTDELDEKEEDDLYDELSCEPCMEDIFDVECFLKDKNINYEVTQDDKEYAELEIWR